jgi:NADH-quinone oxidoreductase subunit L
MEAATTSELIRWIVATPLIGTLLNGLLGRRWNRSGERLIALIGCGSVAVSFAAALVVIGRLLALPEHSRLLVDHLYTWIQVGEFRADVAFAVDPLAAVMLLVVTGVGFLIHVYSVGYMHKDPGFWRYFTYLNLFMFSMLLLVLGDNLLLLFIGWEGVGLCSYLLIGFWYEDREKASAGKKAFVVNRIGDFGFILGVLLLFWSLSAAGHPTVSFAEIEEHVGLLADQAVAFNLPGAGPQILGLCTLIGLLLFVGAVGKSAQIPLYVWLPDAMAGPTPVSALIHAATMVTAGVYMVARMHFLFDIAPGALQVVAVVGAATAFFAATMGIAQTDIKKVLAYSTVSQLGYMFLACGVGAYTAAIFHLMTHAFFKGLLFLGSGSVIHGMGGEQDIRKMGGLAKLMPITTWTFLVATLAISGMPPFAGFFSKDEILFQTSQHATALWTVGALLHVPPLLPHLHGRLPCGRGEAPSHPRVAARDVGAPRRTRRAFLRGRDDRMALGAGRGPGRGQSLPPLPQAGLRRPRAGGPPRRIRACPCRGLDPDRRGGNRSRVVPLPEGKGRSPHGSRDEVESLRLAHEDGVEQVLRR